MTNGSHVNLGGRPEVDYSQWVGTTHFGLKILRVFRTGIKKAGPRVETVCIGQDEQGKACGAITSDARLRDVLRGHTKSCKCRRVSVFKKNINKQVDRLKQPVIAAMWSAHFDGATRKTIAFTHRVIAPVVDFAIRRYQKILDGCLSRGRALATATANVPARASEYLRKAEARVQNKLSRARLEEAVIDLECRVWGWKMREWMKNDWDKLSPHITPFQVCEFA